jgi:hypothetical protein
MEASIVNGVESSADIGNGQSAAVDLKLADCARGDFIFTRRTQKGHFWKPSSFELFEGCRPEGRRYIKTC